MTRLLTGTKDSSTKAFFLKDRDNLVKIKQPSVMDVALLYGANFVVLVVFKFLFKLS